MRTIFAPLFAALLSLSLLAGCSSKKPIVGKWKDNAGQLEFTEDGKLIATYGDKTANGTYTLLDDDHYKMALMLGGTSQEQTVAYTINGDTMTTDNGKGKGTLTRVK